MNLPLASMGALAWADTALGLAEAVGLSPTPCSRRVKRLEESGLIRGHVTLLDEAALGLSLTAMISISMDRHTPDRFEAFEDLELTVKPIHTAACETVRDLRVLVEADLASGDADTLPETGVTAAFFPHGLGHLIGVQVHDVGGHMQDESGNVIDPPSGHRYLRLTRNLEENMTITVEPGLYAIAGSWQPAASRSCLCRVGE